MANTNSETYLANGSIIRVIGDGTIGELTWGDADEAHIVHADKLCGPGPWIMRREQLELASAEEAEAYRARCRALAA